MGMSSKLIVTTSAWAMGFGALLVAATLADPTGAFTTAAAAQEKAKADPNAAASRRVCRNLTPVGSRLTRRICRTQAEWDESQYRTQDGVLQHQMSTATTYEQNSPR